MKGIKHHLHQHIYSVGDFKRFNFLFRAGGGEFFFDGLLPFPRRLFLKLTRIDDEWSTVDSAAISGIGIPNAYLRIGKWNRKNDTFSMHSRLPEYLPGDILKAVNSIFMYVRTGDWATSGITSPGFQPYRTDRCCRCSLKLRSQKSRDLGFGQECMTYVKEELPKYQMKLF